MMVLVYAPILKQISCHLYESPLPEAVFDLNHNKIDNITGAIMLKLYAHPNTRADRALWTLEEAGAPYEYVYVNLRQGEARQPPFLALNPGGKLPVLVDGDLVLTESAAICTYIADRHPASDLVPVAGSADRARYDQWCFFALSELEQPLWSMAKHKFALPIAQRIPAMIETGKWEFGIAAGLLAQALTGRAYIVGERFSVADILLGHTLAWARAFKVPLGHEVLDAYADRLLSRPAFARVKARMNPEPPRA